MASSQPKYSDNLRRWQNLIFWVAVGVSLLPFFLGKFFLTGDGPVHLHNATVFRDLVTGVNTQFYAPFYQLNPNPSPNWISAVLIGLMTLLIPAFLAEKIILTAYILLFATGLRSCLKSLHPEAGFLAILGLPFVHNHAFQMGFFNFSLGLGLLFWVIAYWIKMHDNPSPQKTLKLGLLITVLYLCHPVPWIFGIVGIGGLILGRIITGQQISNKTTGILPQKIALELLGKTGAAALPSIGLFLYFMLTQGGDSAPNPEGFAMLLKRLTNLYALVILENGERYWVLGIGIIIFLLAIYVVFLKLRTKKFRWQDGLLTGLAFSLIIYFIGPEDLAGGGVLSLRLQLFPWLTGLIWLGGALPQNEQNHLLRRIGLGVSGLGLFLILVLFGLRLPTYLNIQEATNEILSSQAYFTPNSTVLPLSFDHNGHTPDGKIITDRIWLFPHAMEYLGAAGGYVLFDNYQGNKAYFPINWKPETNPYSHLALSEGIGGTPPHIDLNGYQKATGTLPEFIVTWGKEGNFQDHPHTRLIEDVLKEKYTRTFISSQKRVEVYKRNF